MPLPPRRQRIPSEPGASRNQGAVCTCLPRSLPQSRLGLSLSTPAPLRPTSSVLPGYPARPRSWASVSSVHCLPGAPSCAATKSCREPVRGRYLPPDRRDADDAVLVRKGGQRLRALDPGPGFVRKLHFSVLLGRPAIAEQPSSRHPQRLYLGSTMSSDLDSNSERGSCQLSGHGRLDAMSGWRGSDLGRPCSSRVSSIAFRQAAAN